MVVRSGSRKGVPESDRLRFSYTSAAFLAQLSQSGRAAQRGPGGLAPPSWPVDAGARLEETRDRTLETGRIGWSVRSSRWYSSTAGKSSDYWVTTTCWS